MITIHDTDGSELLKIEPDDDSYRYRSVMGEHSLTLRYSLPVHAELPVGAYVEYQGERYTLERPENLKMRHSRHFEYTVTFDPPECKAGIWKFRNPADGRLKFPLTAKPREHLQMFVDNMNLREAGWTAGECIEGTETLVAYDHDYCIDALKRMAETFNTEYEFDGRRVSLRKVEYGKEDPLPLSYGRGNGFRSGVGRSNPDETPVETLYVQGGERNIDPSKYRNPSGAPQTELLLPCGRRLEYEGRVYEASADGLSIRRADKPPASMAEDSLDCPEIYPKRVGTVTGVETVDLKADDGGTQTAYDIIDTTIPDDLDYRDCRIAGETATVIFQSGMLAGREFDIVQDEKDLTGYDHAQRRFRLVSAEQDGQLMPGGVFVPREGDTYAVFGISLPDAYIRDDNTQTGASWDMFREAAKYLYEHEDRHFTFTGELDGLWAKRDWLRVGGRIRPGGYVLFTDERFQKEGVPVRITGVKDYVNRPHSPEIELSNETRGTGVSSALKRLEAEEVVNERRHKDALGFTKRRWRDAKETTGMLEAAWQENFSRFSGSVSPLTVRTMQMLAGDESLQFRFVDGRTAPREVSHDFAYDAEKRQLTTEAGIIQHLTLGIDTLCPEHDASEYRFWDMEAYISPVLDDPSKGYYLYAKCSKTAETGSFMLSEQAVAMDGDTDYHLLAGILNSEYEGGRSFVTLYGFTEILPGRITTDKIVSTDGATFFDLVEGIISGRITFQAGSSGLHNLDEWGEADRRISGAQKDADAAQSAADDANTAVGNLNDYVDGAFRDGVITDAEAVAIEKYANGVNGTKSAVDATYEKLYANAFLTGDAKTGLKTAYDAFTGAAEALLSSVGTATADGKATPEEKADVDAKYGAFNEAYKAFEGAVETANKAIQDALKGLSDAALEKAESAAEAAKAAADAAADAAGAVSALEDSVNGAFRDGVITETERRRLENDLNVVNTTLEKVKATYGGLHANAFLTGEAKTGLETAYSSFVTAAGALTESIRNAAADGKATDEETEAVNADYEAFNAAYASFETAVETANKAIQDALKAYSDTAAGNAGGAAKDELARRLGYDSYAGMAEAAEAGETIITGGRINTDLIETDTLLADKTFTHEMLAEWVRADRLEARYLDVTGESHIAGFTVSGNGLTNTPFDNDAYVVFRNDAHKCFAGIGGNILPTTSGLRGVARFENEDADDWWGLRRNIAMYLSAANGRYNHAFMGNGNGTLDGWIAGYRYEWQGLDEKDTIYSGFMGIRKTNRWVVHANATGAGITLPRLSEVQDALCIGADTKFNLEFTVNADTDSREFKVYGRNNIRSADGSCPWDTGELPVITNHNGDYWDSVTLGPGDTVAFWLIRDKDKQGTRGDGWPLTWSARVTSHLS